MNDTITIAHNLTSFNVTTESFIVDKDTTKRITMTKGEMNVEISKTCLHCDGTMHIHQKHTVKIQHVPLMAKPHILAITYTRSLCSCCGYLESQDIPFKDPHHRITKHLKYLAARYLSQGFTLTEVSQLLHIHPSIVKDIDKERLTLLFPTMKAKTYCKHIAVDEFLLHKGHRYATVVIDLDTGDVLFCEEGKKKEQILHFFQAMGENWMKHVEAVSMDMNAQYDSAFRQWAPHIKIVYDLFHMIKLYNDTVITTMRRRKQNELKEDGLKEEYKLFKGMRFVLTSNRSTIQQRDEDAKKNNLFLHENYLQKGLSLPPGARLMRIDREKKLDNLLNQNEDFSVAYILLEQLKLAFAEKDKTILKNGMNMWLKLAKQSKVVEILKYADTIERHLEGIINHADYPISSGKLEGTNNLIKTIRRKAYGFHDTGYFFLKIMEASRRPKAQYKSHKKMC